MFGKKTFTLVLMALAGVLTFILIYGDQGVLHLRRLNQEKIKLEAENADLKEKNRRITQQIERIKADPRCIEDEARKKLGLVRPDETIYRLQEEPDTGRPGTTRQ